MLLFSVHKNGKLLSMTWSLQIAEVLELVNDKGEYADRILAIARELLEVRDAQTDPARGTNEGDAAAGDRPVYPKEEPG